MTTDITAERASIESAMERLLAGEPRQSTGALTILQLAAEAGVKRWVLTHKHTDLADEFRRRTHLIGGIPAAFRRLHDRAVSAEAANRALRTENEQLREQVTIYAQVIHELTTERRTVSDGHQGSREIHAMPGNGAGR
ncbi:hypothetical protein [Prescottella equi]